MTLAAGCAFAQTAQQMIQRGEQLFSTTCGSGYCHGGRGAGGGAPRLAARGFDQTFIANTVSRGVNGTSMPAFATTLAAADLNAIVAYVASLNGIANPTASRGGQPPVQPLKRTAEVLKGEALFSDAVRGFARCSTCHQVGSLGIPVANPIHDIPENPAALKSLATPHVSTVTVGGVGTDAMPALVVAQKSGNITFYDLTKPPPVLRSELPAQVQIREGSNWRHSSVIGSYNDAELTSILNYLRDSVR